MDSAPPTRTHGRVCAQAEEWSPQRAAATSRLTRKKKPQKKSPELRHEQRAAPELVRAGKNRHTRPARPLRERGRGPLSPLFCSFAALSDGAAAHAAQERGRQKRRSSAQTSAGDQRPGSNTAPVRFRLYDFLFHFSRVMHVHALAGGKKKGCVPRGGPRAFR